MILLLLAAAQAVTADQVLARVAEVAPLRAGRLASGAPPLTEAMYREAAAGEVPTALQAVEGIAAKKAYGVAVVDVSIGRYWAALNDDAGKLERTRMDYSEILSGAPCRLPRTVFQYLPTVRPLSDRWWVSDFDQNTAAWAATGGRVRELRWEAKGERRPTSGVAAQWAARGVPLAFNTGAWLLIALDAEHTLVEYYTWSDPGGSVPAGLVNGFSASGIPDVVRTIEQLARDGPGCPIE